ncbi:GpE family phage tail protein [Vibrio coralliilyticus]|nr:GpE family phage tail protein [Vibrio coralliilyticus]
MEHVEDYYADIAVVLGWQPSELDRLSYEDLLLFREKARVRHERKESE